MDPVETYRRNLLPKWIRAFCWFFLLIGSVAPLLLVVGPFYRKPMHIGVYGWGHSGSPYQPTSLLVIAYYVLCGVAAFGLLGGRRWAWLAAFVVGVVGFGLALTSPLNAPAGTIRIPFEVIVQIPFLVVLWRIRERWYADAVPT